MKLFKLVLTIVALMPLVAQADTILLKGKKPISGVKIVSETMKEITYSKNGKSKKTVAAAEVVAVVYDRQPVNFRIGSERFSLGDFVNAVSRLKPAVDEGESDQPWVKPYALLFLGKSQFANGEFRDAIATFKQLMPLVAGHRIYPEAALSLARSQSLDGLHDDAKSTLTKLVNVLEQNGVKGPRAMQAKLAMAESFMAAAKFSLAADAFKEVAAAATGAKGKVEELAFHAKARLLAANLMNKDNPKAKIVLSELRSASQKRSSAAQAAYRGAKVTMLLLGGDGAQAPGTKELLEAAFDLSKARGENFTVVSEMPRNCYLLGVIHLKLDGSLSKAKELAKGYFEETRRVYPESREAFLARDELKKM
ncbi:MAG: TolA-binding protein [Planctomycetota bacterium]|jgi:TolA-binding protein